MNGHWWLHALVTLSFASGLSCAASDAGSMGDGKSRGVVLSVDEASWAFRIGEMNSPEGRVFVVVDATIETQRADAQDVTLASAFLTVTTIGGLTVAMSPLSVTLPGYCPGDSKLTGMGSLHCAAAFEIPDNDVPVDLGFIEPNVVEVWTPLQFPDCERCGGPSCVDLATSVEHCGECSSPVTNGYSCEDGLPSCDGDGHTVCDGACVDTNTSSEHCGGCSQPIAPNQTCEGGEPQGCAEPGFPCRDDAGCCGSPENARCTVESKICGARCESESDCPSDHCCVLWSADGGPSFCVPEADIPDYAACFASPVVGDGPYQDRIESEPFDREEWRGGEVALRPVAPPSPRD